MNTPNAIANSLRQIAISSGARVFATGSASQRAAIEQFGATFIDYKTTSVQEYIEQFTGGVGYDIVFDTVGGETLDASFTAAKTYTGHVVSALGWGTHKLAPLSFKAATYSGIFTLLPLLTGKCRKHHGDILRKAAALWESGQLTVRLEPTNFTLETVDKAYALLQSGKAAGKVVVSIH